jgi:hypothetical protein
VLLNDTETIMNTHGKKTGSRSGIPVNTWAEEEHPWLNGPGINSFQGAKRLRAKPYSRALVSKNDSSRLIEFA